MKGVCLLFRQLEVHGFCKLIQLVFSKFDFDTETLHFQAGRFEEKHRVQLYKRGNHAIKLTIRVVRMRCSGRLFCGMGPLWATYKIIPDIRTHKIRSY